MSDQHRTEFVDELRNLLEVTIRSEAADGEFATATAQVRDAAAVLGSLPAADVPWYWSRLALPEPFALSLGDAWGRFNPLAPKVSYSVGDDGEVVGRLVAGVAHGGPPGGLHGGVIAALIDQTMATCLTNLARPSLTLNLTIDYVALTPLHSEISVHAGQAEVSGRKTHMWAEVRSGGTITARAKGTFLAIRRTVG